MAVIVEKEVQKELKTIDSLVSALQKAKGKAAAEEAIKALADYLLEPKVFAVLSKTTKVHVLVETKLMPLAAKRFEESETFLYEQIARISRKYQIPARL